MEKKVCEHEIEHQKTVEKVKEDMLFEELVKEIEAM